MQIPFTLKVENRGTIFPFEFEREEIMRIVSPTFKFKSFASLEPITASLLVDTSNSPSIIFKYFLKDSFSLYKFSETPRTVAPVLPFFPAARATPCLSTQTDFIPSTSETIFASSSYFTKSETPADFIP